MSTAPSVPVAPAVPAVLEPLEGVDVIIHRVLRDHGLSLSSTHAIAALRLCFTGARSTKGVRLSPYELEAGAAELTWVIACLAPLALAPGISPRQLISGQAVMMMSWLHRNVVRIPSAADVGQLLASLACLKHDTSRHENDPYADPYVLLFGQRTPGRPNPDFIAIQAQRLAAFLNDNLEPYPGTGPRRDRLALRLRDDVPVATAADWALWAGRLGPVPKRTVKDKLTIKQIVDAAVIRQREHEAAALKARALRRAAEIAARMTPVPDPDTACAKELLGDYVRRSRKRLGMNRVEFSRRCGIGRVALKRVEDAESALTLDTLMRLAAGLDTTASRLLADIEARTATHQ